LEKARIQKEQEEARIQAKRDRLEGFAQSWILRQELREANDSNQAPVPRKQEANIKKIQTFLRKLQRISHVDDGRALVQGVYKHKLKRYLAEVVEHLSDIEHGSSKDILLRVQIASALHQKYGREFTSEFRKRLVDIFNPEKIELSEGLSEKEQAKQLLQIHKRQKNNLLMLIEMGAVGLLKEGKMFIQLADFFMRSGSRRKLIDRLDLLAHFLQHGGEEILQITPNFILQEYEELEIEVPQRIYCTVKAKYSKQIRENFINFFKDQLEELTEVYERYRKVRKSNKRSVYEKGEAPASEVRKEEEFCVLHDEFRNRLERISCFLNIEMPEVPEDEDSEDELIIEIDNQSLTIDAAAKQSFFEDEESRIFYESLIDMRHLLPALVFEKGGAAKLKKEMEAEAKTVKSEEENNGNEENNTSLDDQIRAKEDEISDIEDYEAQMESLAKELENEDKPVVDIKSTKQLKIEDLFQKMLESYSRKEIDDIAMEYCLQRDKNTDSIITQLIYSLKMRHCNRIPSLARFVSLFHLVGIDLTSTLITKVEAQFYGIFKSKDPESLMIRVRNARFIAEFTKFNLFPLKKLFIIINKLTVNFSPLAIRTLACLLENCGRWLYLNPLSHQRLLAAIKIIRQKQKATFVHQELENYIENALYYCCPPPGKTIEAPPPLSTMQQFVQKLIVEDLTPKNLVRILRILRSLPWDDVELANFVNDTLLTTASLRYQQINEVARVIGGLSHYQPRTSTYIVDAIFEAIRESLDHNNPGTFQRDLSFLKFLGELYSYRLVDSQSIFDLLYILMSYGVDPNSSQTQEQDKKAPDANDSESDSDEGPTEFDFTMYFRVHAIAVLLGCCGEYFTKGSLRLRRDRFLLSLLKHTASVQPLPLSVNNIIDELFENARKFEKPNDWEEWKEQVEILDEELKNQASILDFPDDLPQLDNDLMEKNESEQTETESFKEEEEEEKAYAGRRDKVRIKEAQEMDEELSKLMKESLEEVRRDGSLNRQNLSDASQLAYSVRQQESTSENDFGNEDDEIVFKFVTRAKGSKIRSANLFVPKDSAIAEAKIDKTEEEERKKLKIATLQTVRQQEDEEEENEFDEEYQRYRQEILKSRKRKQFAHKQPKKYKDNKPPHLHRHVPKHGLQNIDEYFN